MLCYVMLYYIILYYIILYYIILYYIILYYIILYYIILQLEQLMNNYLFETCRDNFHIRIVHLDIIKVLFIRQLMH